MSDALFIGLGRVGLRSLKFFKELVRGARIYAVDKDPNLRLLVDGLGDVEFHEYRPEVLSDLAKKASLAVTALPSSVAFDVISDLVKRGVSVVDVSFFAEDPYLLERCAAKYGSVFVPDAGFAPGYSNLVVGHAVKELGALDSVDVLVGEVPLGPAPPLDHAVTWNPSDLIEEYTRPARVVEDYQVKVVDPLESVIEVELSGLGRFEGFASDGLRTLIRNVRAKRMREVTIRRPGHLSKMRLLRDLGLMSREAVRVGDVEVRPAELLAKLLEARTPKDVECLAVLYVRVSGPRGEISELATLRGTPESPAIPTFTALVHAYTAKLVYEGEVRSGVRPLEDLAEFKDEYDIYLRSKGVDIAFKRA
jgi:saccharopine dehydrogenase-like NADP-dependent oxidoreductase